MRCYYQCTIANQDLETKVYFSNQEGYGGKLQTGHGFQSRLIYHWHKTQSWSLSNETVQGQIGEQENIFARKPSYALHPLIRWKTMLFEKFRKLLTSALWIQTISRTRLMFQLNCIKTSILIFRANWRASFYVMETLGWNKCSETSETTEISVNIIPPNKWRVLKALHLWVSTLKYAVPFNKHFSSNKRCSSLKVLPSSNISLNKIPERYKNNETIKILLTFRCLYFLI